MRERLTELIQNADTYDGHECKLCTKDDVSCGRCGAEKLADHLLANGVIVPPVRVGQTVYSFCDCFGAILPYDIQNFSIGFLGKDIPNYWFWEAASHAPETDELLDEIEFDLENFGETVFLTRKDAERAILKRGDENA